MAAPLTDLLKKEDQTIWTNVEETTANTPADCRMPFPVLMKPDFNKPFFLSTDTSGTADGFCSPRRQVIPEKASDYCFLPTRIHMKGAEVLSLRKGALRHLVGCEEVHTLLVLLAFYCKN